MKKLEVYGEAEKQRLPLFERLMREFHEIFVGNTDLPDWPDFDEETHNKNWKEVVD